MRSVIRSRAWDFVEVSFCASSDLTEVSHTTVLVLRQEVVSLVIYTKSNGVGTWPRDLQFLFILFMRFTGKAVGRFSKSRAKFIGARAWVFIDFDCSEWPSSFHLLPALAEAKALGEIGSEGSLDIIGVGWWVLGRTKQTTHVLLGEIVFMSNSQRSGPAGVDCGGEVVIPVAEYDLPAVKACSFGKGVEHFRGRAVGGTAADFVAIGNSN